MWLISLEFWFKVALITANNSRDWFWYKSMNKSFPAYCTLWIDTVFFLFSFDSIFIAIIFFLNFGPYHCHRIFYYLHCCHYQWHHYHYNCVNRNIWFRYYNEYNFWWLLCLYTSEACEIYLIVFPYNIFYIFKILLK